jgi:site-specific recombinase XerD
LFQPSRIHPGESAVNRVRELGGGSHLFRHSLATQMLQQGASLPEIGDL